jgi:glycosyltransferase involved in cell wall biosynthesis
MLQFVPPKLNAPARPARHIPADKTSAPVRLNPDRTYIFGSTHIDVGGCSYYRILFISQLLSQVYSRALFCDTRLLFNYQAVFPALSSFRLQRACSIRDLRWLREVLIPAKDMFHFPVVYEIDDILVREDIPVYNCYRDIFKEGKDSIPIYMNTSDAVTVTCAPLADYYSRKFGLPRGKFRVVPNYLPRYFFDFYDERVILERIRSQKSRKPRICFSCGMSHFDMNRTGAGDDFSGILDWIAENRRKYEFVFHGGFPPELEKFKRDFQYVPIGPFLDYPRVRRSIRADLFIQPLRHSMFNECKSPIKLLEAWAEGTPAFVQDLGSYMQIAPEACFDTAETLDRMVNALFADPDAQIQTIRANYARMGNYWLDNHLNEWLDVMLFPKGR